RRYGKANLAKKPDDCMDAGGRATQEQLPSLHGVNEDFFAKFNAARPSKVVFQQAVSGASRRKAA
ncbi:MAG TPA: hypothetical protein PK129_08985, partial [Cellvibrionaceae bacterium]|nr:hypothetical protein [Cellvibrionaceae bacterium]